MTEFKKMLVYVDQVKIDAEVTSWEDLIAGLNDFWGKWKGYFHEPLTLKEFSMLQSHHDHGFYIQEKKVLQNPDHKQFQKSLNVKMDKLLEMVKLPPHQHLVDGLKEIQVNLLGKIHASNWSQWQNQLFDGEKFEMAPELESDIRERFSYYTENKRQNLVFLYLKKFAGIVNILHDTGYRCDLRDWPTAFMRCFDSVPTRKIFKDLSHSNGENPDWYIHNFEVSRYMLRDDNPLLRYFSNYSETEVDELIERLSNG